MMTRHEIEDHLTEAEYNAIKSLSQNKWERFGYWAAVSVHLRKILGIQNTASPFRPFADLARQELLKLENKSKQDTGIFSRLFK